MTHSIYTIIGARPQFVKAAVVSKAIMKTKDVRETIIHTGQHFDANMSSIFFEELGIQEASVNLSIGGGTHGQNTGRMIEAIEAILLKEKPDSILVYGDTDSTLAGALAAAKIGIPIHHVEAGLRSFNREMPEEINRILTDQLSSTLFAPSKVAYNNLKNEGVAPEKIKITGDVMYDAVRAFTSIAKSKSNILEKVNFIPKSYILATLHRKENTDNVARLSSILEGLGRSNLPVILPLHPRTKARMESFNLEWPTNLFIIDPVGYLDMMLLEACAFKIATDSGGVQKEAFFHQVPCITLRDETEWVELVEIGANTLVGADATLIERAINSPASINTTASPYGDGTASDMIAAALASFN